MFRRRFVYQGITGIIESELPLEVGPPRSVWQTSNPCFCLFVCFWCTYVEECSQCSSSGNREIGFVPSLHFTMVDSLLGIRMLRGEACGTSEGISQVAPQGRPLSCHTRGFSFSSQNLEFFPQ